MHRAQRTDPKIRKVEILLEAVSCAERVGLENLTRQEIADEIKIKPQLINHYLGDLEQIKKEVLQYAIDNEKIGIVAQGLASKRIAPGDLPQNVRESVIGYMMTGGRG